MPELKTSALAEIFSSLRYMNQMLFLKGKISWNETYLLDSWSIWSVLPRFNFVSILGRSTMGLVSWLLYCSPTLGMPTDVKTICKSISSFANSWSSLTNLSWWPTCLSLCRNRWSLTLVLRWLNVLWGMNPTPSIRLAFLFHPHQTVSLKYPWRTESFKYIFETKMIKLDNVKHLPGPKRTSVRTSVCCGAVGRLEYFWT